MNIQKTFGGLPFLLGKMGNVNHFGFIGLTFDNKKVIMIKEKCLYWLPWWVYTKMEVILKVNFSGDSQGWFHFPYIQFYFYADRRSYGD